MLKIFATLIHIQLDLVLNFAKFLTPNFDQKTSIITPFA